MRVATKLPGYNPCQALVKHALIAYEPPDSDRVIAGALNGAMTCHPHAPHPARCLCHRDPLVRERPPTASWWHQYTEWRASAASSRSGGLALKVLHHISQLAGTRARGERAAQLRRQQQHLAMQLTALAPGASPAAAAAAAAAAADDSCDDSDMEAAQPRFAAEEEEGAADVDGLNSMLEGGVLEAGVNSAAHAAAMDHMRNSLSLLAGSTFKNAPAAAITATRSHRAAAIAAASRAARLYSPPMQGSSSSSNSSRGSSRGSSVSISSGGRTWRLDVVGAPQGLPQPSSAGPPPFIRTTRRPAIQETACLFGLSPDQALPFAVAAATIERAAADPSLEQPPLRMVIVGKPGTGTGEGCPTLARPAPCPPRVPERTRASAGHACFPAA